MVMSSRQDDPVGSHLYGEFVTVAVCQSSSVPYSSRRCPCSPLGACIRARWATPGAKARYKTDMSSSPAGPATAHMPSYWGLTGDVEQFGAASRIPRCGAQTLRTPCLRPGTPQRESAGPNRPGKHPPRPYCSSCGR